MRPPLSRRRPFEAAPETEVNDELQFHLEQRVREYVERGMDPDAARAAAVERFGDVSGVRRACTQLLDEDRRAERRRGWFDDLGQDLRFGVRSALRSPLFSLMAVITLALGIGANAAVFGVVKSVLLDALPYTDADELVRVYSEPLDAASDRGPLSAGVATDLAGRLRRLTRVAHFHSMPSEIAYTGGEVPQVVTGGLVGGTFFQTLGITPALGRPLGPDDAEPGADPVAMLSHATWQRLFAGDSAAVGRDIPLDGVRHTIVGVLPRGFVGPMGEADVWLPADISSWLQSPVSARRSHFLGVVGRLAPGATIADAEREVAALGTELAREYPDSDASHRLATAALHDDMVGDTRTPLIILMASAGLVLLITCANLAGALLSRALSRRAEFAVRTALGAPRGRLVRQLLTESVVLAIAGGLAGMAIAAGALAALRALALEAIPDHASLQLDPEALLITGLVAVITGLAFGTAPALAVARAAPQGTLRDATRGASEGRRARMLRGALVAGQIALSVSLLAGAGLLARSLWAMTSAPLGFTTAGLLAVEVRLPEPEYERAELFFRQLDERVRSLPGVTAVANGSAVPTRVMSNMGFTIEGVTWSAESGTPFAPFATVSDDFFRVLEIPLRQGRTFSATDGADAPTAIVISEGMARRFWPDGDAVGARIRFGPNLDAPWSHVVGVVGDVRDDLTSAEPRPMIYASTRQSPWPMRTYLLQTPGDPLALVQPFQRELTALDPTLPIHRAVPLDALVGEGLAGRRVPVLLVTGFGVLALLLASVGVYAMFASMAAAREREFGVRVALGSSRAAIAGLVLRQGAVWMAVGLAGGAIGVLVVARLVGDLLFGVAPLDPLVIGATAAVLLLCSAAALAIPVRRATRVDPISALR